MDGLYKSAKATVARAVDMDERGETLSQACFELYQEGKVKLEHGTTMVPRNEQEIAVQAKMSELLRLVKDRIEIISQKQNTSGGETRAKQIFSSLDTNLAHSILNEVLTEKSSTTFKDVIGQDTAKQALRENIVLPSLRPDIFTGLRCPMQGILLHGPPGNGKTLLAKAAANQSHYTFFNISAASLTSKWVGESERLMRILFALARKMQPSIIFIDEVDSILSARHEGENDVSRRLKTEFLTQLDGVGSNKEDQILVIGATNRPQDLDSAVLRRFPVQILVDKPLLEDRTEILKHFMGPEKHVLTDDHFAELALLTEDYSASDLSSLARRAAFQVLREIPTEEICQIEKDNIRPVDLADFIEVLDLK